MDRQEFIGFLVVFATTFMLGSAQTAADGPVVLTQKDSLRCFECNVFRGSTIRSKCDEPQVEERCSVCIKVETMMYYNFRKPKYGGIHSITGQNITSRLCGRATEKQDDGCYFTYGSAGYSRKCYCSTELCNAAPSLFNSRNQFVAAIVITAIGLVFARLR
ncbi:uncharacterized protein LOC141912678 [Tubulanus polymorphus]|uniref:uncharacterized protein LOC141912678 n=1 Tax=Tubulanus polymorphus TaxID=672921 RepID=UPI003DA2FC21